MNELLHRTLEKKMVLLLTWLQKPKDKILEFLPLLIAKSILLIYAEYIKGPVDEIFGILGHP